MKNYESFWVQKTPQSFDETLVAFGLATVVQTLLDKQSDEAISITITDEGAGIALSLKQPLLAETVVRFGQELMPVPAIATKKTKLPEGITCVQYEDVREIVQNFFKAPKDVRETLDPPPLEWDVYRAINPASLPGYNSMMVDWHTVRHESSALFIVLDLYSQVPNDFDVAIDRWKALAKSNNWKIKPEVTRQQLYNPDSGKGLNRTKPDAIVSPSNVNGFWLSEWLKAIGFYEGALTKQLRGVKDRKTIVLAPRKLTFEQHRQIRSKFVSSMRVAETAIRFDVLAVIRYAIALLEFIEDNADDPLLALLEISDLKQRVVAGFHTAFYKDMGNAIATMNLSFVGLPGWIEIDDERPAASYRPLLDELLAITRQFDESRSDDFTLLQHLRDFVSGDDFRQFLKFTTGYSSYYMKKRERGYALALSTQFIERMVKVMGKKFAELANREAHPGFHNIAAAIAQVTVWAQHSKDSTPYKIRYGLHRELARQAQKPEKFVRAISAFIHSYNAETMRAQELNKPHTGLMIQPADIDDLLEIIDQFDNDSQLVAEVLLAYGSTFTKSIKSKKETN